MEIRHLIKCLWYKVYSLRYVHLTSTLFFREDPNLQVYHCSTGEANPVTWGQFNDIVVELVRKHPCMEVLWYPASKCRQYSLRSRIAVLLLHILPALAFLVLTKIWGKPNRL
jgi:fatty acyl-CoA reductase